MVTLKAIVDVTDRDTVNVNMLTHMEAPRATFEKMRAILDELNIKCWYGQEKEENA